MSCRYLSVSFHVATGGALILTIMDEDDLSMSVNSDIVKKILCLEKIMNAKPARLASTRTNLVKNGYPDGSKKVHEKVRDKIK